MVTIRMFLIKTNDDNAASADPEDKAEVSVWDLYGPRGDIATVGIHTALVPRGNQDLESSFAHFRGGGGPPLKSVQNS